MFLLRQVKPANQPFNHKLDEVYMYHYPVNSLEFKKGYRLGVQKGRSIERKLALVLVISFVLVFEVVHWILIRGCK